MKSSPRAALLLAPAVLGCAVAIALLWRGERPPAHAAPAPDVSAATPEPTAPEPSQAAAPAAVVVPPPSAPAAAETPTADSLAAAMHALEDSQPERALELARQGQALWPAGPRAAEFAATEVKCLYLLGKPSEGRGTAEAMVNQYPGSPWALEVEKQTGAHPHVNH